MAVPMHPPLFKNSREMNEFLRSSNEEYMVQLQSRGLLPLKKRCPMRQCRRPCPLIALDRRFLGHCFACSHCRTKYSLTKGTLFKGMKISISEWFHILWMWINKARMGIIADCLMLAVPTVLKQVRYLRDVCSWKLVQDRDSFLLGGPGHVVLIDESELTPAGNPRGRQRAPVWIIGMYDVTIKRGYVRVIPNRSSHVLMKHITRMVCTGSEIWTDEFRSYQALSTLEGVSPYVHKVVKHLRSFIDPERGIRCNALECWLARTKLFIRFIWMLLLVEHYDFLWGHKNCRERCRQVEQQLLVDRRMQLAEHRYPSEKWNRQQAQVRGENGELKSSFYGLEE